MQLLVRIYYGSAWPCNLVRSCFITDVDEQKRVQEDLRRANEDLEQFAFTASHDLREPARTVRICSEPLAMRHGEEVSQAAQQALTYIRRAATRMVMLVPDLLAWAERDKSGLSRETTDATKR
jgi:light-regulated signal transduction histidine kinase (bacteriophytochrome)